MEMTEFEEWLQRAPAVEQGNNGQASACNSSLSYEDVSAAVLITHYCITLVTVVLIFLGNLLMITIILRYPWFHCPQGCLFFSIASADLIIGVDILLGLVTLIRVPHVPEGAACKGCDVIGYVTAVAITVNVLTIAVLSFDRWLLIHRPFSYAVAMTTRRAIGACGAVWVLSVLLYTPYFAQWISFRYLLHPLRYICVVVVHSDHQMALLIISLPGVAGLVAILVFGILTCRTARAHLRRIQALERDLHSGGPEVDGTPPPQPPPGGRARRVPARRRRQVARPSAPSKHVKTTLLMILAFVVTWAPMHLVHVLVALRADLAIPPALLYMLAWLMVSNSYLNWIICLTTDARFLKAIRLLMHDVTGCAHACSKVDPGRPRVGSCSSTNITTIT